MLAHHSKAKPNRQKPLTIRGQRSPISTTPLPRQSQALDNPIIQAKLRIGAPNDKYEQEADRAADEVMRMRTPRLANSLATDNQAASPPFIQRACSDCQSGGSLCPECAEEETLRRQPEEDDETLQTKSGNGNVPSLTPQTQRDINGLRGRGQPLSSSERAFFEPRFGASFATTRVHNDATANALASRINARAFTVGGDICFGPNEYRPRDPSGQRLLAHELTHTLQQSRDARIQRKRPPSDGASPSSKKSESIPRPEDKMKWDWKDLLIYPLFVDLWNDIFAQKLTAAEKKEF